MAISRICSYRFKALSTGALGCKVIRRTSVSFDMSIYRAGGTSRGDTRKSVARGNRPYDVCLNLRSRVIVHVNDRFLT